MLPPNDKHKFINLRSNEPVLLKEMAIIIIIFFEDYAICSPLLFRSFFLSFFRSFFLSFLSSFFLFLSFFFQQNTASTDQLKNKGQGNKGRGREGNGNRLMPPPDCTIFGTSEHTNLFSVACEHWLNIRVMKWSQAINLCYAGQALIRTDGFTVYEHQTLWSGDEIKNRSSLEQRERY